MKTLCVHGVPNQTGEPATCVQCAALDARRESYWGARSAPSLCDCGHPPTSQAPDSITTGYGTDANEKTACFPCCAEKDRASMIATGKAHLYIGARVSGYRLTNWSGSLAFAPLRFTEKNTHQGFGGRKNRVDVWFVGPDGYEWHGYHASDWSSIISVRRTKKMAWKKRVAA